MTSKAAPGSVDEILREYNSSDFEEYRSYLARRLLMMASSEPAAEAVLPYILNGEQGVKGRLRIVRFLGTRVSAEAAAALSKALFDSEAQVRAAAAVALASFTSQRTLLRCLPALVEALSDPVTQHHAEKAVRVIFGPHPVSISASERARLRRGETPEEVWPLRFGDLRARPERL